LPEEEEGGLLPRIHPGLQQPVLGGHRERWSWPEGLGEVGGCVWERRQHPKALGKIKQGEAAAPSAE